MDELRHDVKAVLNGMIFHPRCHTHLKDIEVTPGHLDQNSSGLKLHEIRIGGGIENPYVFLFHLRYQFCLVDQIRKTERQRLIDLFVNAIRGKDRTVDAPKLLNFRPGKN